MHDGSSSAGSGRVSAIGEDRPNGLIPDREPQSGASSSHDDSVQAGREPRFDSWRLSMNENLSATWEFLGTYRVSVEVTARHLSAAVACQEVVHGS